MTDDLIIRADATGESLYAARPFRAGEMVLALDQVDWRPTRDMHTVTDPVQGHFFHPMLRATAHACEPNCAVRFDPRALVALADIAAGEAINIDYQATEAVIGSPFDCLCGSSRCRGRIG